MASEAQPVVDTYGFALACTPEQAAARQRCDEKQARQAAKWAKALAAGRLPTGDKLKKLCRKGVPPELRPRVWPQVSGAAAWQAQHIAGYFEAMVARGEAESEFARQIELDLPRTFPANAWVAGAAGQAALRRVLLAFSAHAPSMGYCQGMNYLAAMALLALACAEEGAFWVLAAMIDDGGILYRNTYAHNLVGAHVEMRSLEELVAAKLPRLHRRLAELGCDMTILATDWFLCLYATSVPCETALRVWDALLNEGGKVLYRVALALLRAAEPDLAAQDNAGDVLRVAKAAAAAAHDRDALLKAAFDGVGSMPMARIRNFRAEQQQAVDAEMLRRAARQQGAMITCVVIVAYLGLNAGLNMTNKWALGIYGFRFPLLLTSCHMAFSFLILAPFMAYEPFRSKHRNTVRKQWRGLLMMGLFMAANISLNNLSLTLISLSLNQVIRSSLPVVTAVLAVFIDNRYPSRSEFVSLTVLSAGVMLAVWEGTVAGSPSGIMLCIAATLCNGAMMVTAGKIMSEKVDALRLTFYTAPSSCAVLAPFFYGREAGTFLEYLPAHMQGVAGILIVSSCLALAYNVVHATMIHRLSAVTTTVLGEAKIVALLVLSALFLGEDRVFTLKMTVGCALALIGFGLYSAVRLRQSQAAPPPKRPASEEDPNPLPKSSSLSAEMEPLVAKQSSLHQLELKAAAGRTAAE
ncbi:hypothetical protein WJX81_002190 [Elliptochloris bilobata]|uniref:Rab-GAP TBC domain-containing protein n=1 Tax=Elliptochloris bilobata TaxID=381761 RepID=A0AAW1RD64_9CHLO